MSVRGAVLLVLLAATGCASTTLPRSGLNCPDDAVAKTADDGERGFREWCEAPGTSHGPWIRYYPSGVRAEEANVVRGKIDGLYTKYFESGKPQMVTEWRDYRREGLETRWHENGNVEWRGYYLHNRREGIWTAWFANGRTAFTGNYRQNEPTGAWSFWNPDGTTSRIENFDLPPQQVGQNPNLENGMRLVRGLEELPVRHEFWVDGHKHGPWRTFDEHGVLREVEVYSGGQVIEHWVRP